MIVMEVLVHRFSFDVINSSGCQKCLTNFLITTSCTLYCFWLPFSNGVFLLIWWCNYSLKKNLVWLPFFKSGRKVLWQTFFTIHTIVMLLSSSVPLKLLTYNLIPKMFFQRDVHYSLTLGKTKKMIRLTFLNNENKKMWLTKQVC